MGIVYFQRVDNIYTQKMFTFNNDFFLPMHGNFEYQTMRNSGPRNCNPRQKTCFEIPMDKSVQRDSIKTKISDGQIFISFSSTEKVQNFNLKSDHTLSRKLPKYVFEDKMEKDVKLELKGGKLILTVPEKKVVERESKVINIPITFEEKDVEIESLEEKSDKENCLANDDVVMVEVKN